MNRIVVIFLSLFLISIGGFAQKSGVKGILTDATCADNTTTLTTVTYTVLSTDCTITIDAFSLCSSACV